MSERNVFVYVMSEAGGAYLKVGLAFNAHKRLAQVQNGNPRKLTLEHIAGPMTREMARQVEYRAHTVLTPDRGVGEWFCCDKWVAINAVVDAQRWVRNRRGELGHFPQEKRSAHLGRPNSGWAV